MKDDKGHSIFGAIEQKVGLEILNPGVPTKSLRSRGSNELDHITDSDAGWHGAGLWRLFRPDLAQAQKGRELITARDKRLYPDNYDQLQKADRKRLYRIHTWQEAWDRHRQTFRGNCHQWRGGVSLFDNSVRVSSGYRCMTQAMRNNCSVDYWRSSASYRVRIALHTIGLPFETVPVDLFEARAHPRLTILPKPPGSRAGAGN